METLPGVLGKMVWFVYHCFDRVKINGYLSGLTRPGNVEYFFRTVNKAPCIEKQALIERTRRYQGWVEGYARNRKIPIEWAEKGVRKEDAALPKLRRMERENRFGVYFIYRSMELGPAFRIAKPKYPTGDPNYRILSKTRGLGRGAQMLVRGRLPQLRWRARAAICADRY